MDTNATSSPAAHDVVGSGDVGVLVESTLPHPQAVLVLAMIALVAVLAAEAKARGLDVHLGVVLRAISESKRLFVDCFIGNLPATFSGTVDKMNEDIIKTFANLMELSLIPPAT